VIADSDGKVAVMAARSIAEAEIRNELNEPEMPETFRRSAGVFVTVLEYPSERLRGCIGYPRPVFALADALRMAARSVCHDPRFLPLTEKEVVQCIFEVTILTTPEKIIFKDADELVSSVNIGEDGLIMSYEGCRGLFLPQVPVEQGWDVFQYLSNLAQKAGLPPDAWKCKGAKFEKFKGEIFSEDSPGGKIRRKNI